VKRHKGGALAREGNVAREEGVDGCGEAACGCCGEGGDVGGVGEEGEDAVDVSGEEAPKGREVVAFDRHMEGVLPVLRGGG
jgi:hypothetical protein